MLIDRIVLFPYYIALELRNAFYDLTAHRRPHYEIPTICVGNITMGGTGKTPHTEMIIRMFEEEHRIAVVSRGYGRRTRGYREVTIDDTFRTVGDEPLQIKRKFPNVRVVVDKNRNRAMSALCALPEEERPTLVIFDDAFQYRRMVPDCSILLVNFNRPIFSDSLFPIGKLRDTVDQVKRANIVMVTNFPDDDVAPTEKARWGRKLRLKQDCSLFFSRIEYCQSAPVFPDEADRRYIYSKSAVLFSGIAKGDVFKRNMQRIYDVKSDLTYPDHHVYSRMNFRAIARRAKHNPTAAIITTEKDMQRVCGMKRENIPALVRRRLFYVPICAQVIPESDNNYILDEVTSNQMGMDQLKQAILCRLSSSKEATASQEK